jgi:DNA polymerase III delta prime subunit
MRQQTGAPLILFYSYAHEDEQLREQLEKHLRLLTRQGTISTWHDRQIVPGARWAGDVDTHLEAASIILLLISPDFLASEYLYGVEMQRALERQRQGKARVIPVLLRPVDWSGTPFADLEPLPQNKKFVTTWRNRDEAFHTIAQGVRVATEELYGPLPRRSVRPVFAQDHLNRERLLKRVRTIWIEGVLEHSLHQASLIALDLQEQPDALANPWHFEVQETDQPSRPFPAGTSIVQIYDESDGELLILGEPGAGKTTLLLELARRLLDLAEKEEDQCLPVLFNLSSWTQRRLPLVKWLVEELWTKYQVPRALGNTWITAGQILPLLDGLDEVAEDVRSDCVQAINTYHQAYLEKGLANLIVCCRSKEYMALPTRVHLYQAVSIQPLTDDQIERYLQSAKGQLEMLQHALQSDPELYKLAQRPLMLSIFTLAYHGATPQDLPMAERSDEQQSQIFATYVERMFSRRSVSKLFSPQHMRRWLTFVAARMRQHGQAEFYLEYIQLDWLIARQRRLLYRVSVGLCTVLASVLTGMLTGVLIFVLIFGLYGGLKGSLVGGLFFGLNSGLFFGLIGGLGAGIIGGLVVGLSQIRLRERLSWSWKITKQRSAAWLFGVLIGGLISGGLIGGLLFGLLGVLIGGLTFGLNFGLLFGLLGMLIGGLTGRLIVGFSANQLDDHTRLTPNQGIWRSIQNGLIFVFIFVLIFVLIGALFGVLIGGQSADLVGGLDVGLVVGLVSGLSVGLIFGLGTFFQHFTLRIFLWQAGLLPWNVVAFVDQATERLLLRKVGGGYIFVHRLLLDYFADLERKDPSTYKC